MTQATRVGQLTFTDYLDRAWREGAMWTLICAACYLVLALATYAPTDPGWSYVGADVEVSNAGGRAGAWFADVAFYLLGLLAYLIPVMVVWSAWLMFRQREAEPETKLYWLALRWVGLLLTLAAGCALATIQITNVADWLPNGIGGGLGLILSGISVEAFGEPGSALMLSAVLVLGITLVTGVSPLLLVDGVGDLTLWLLSGLGRLRMPRIGVPWRRAGSRQDEVPMDESDLEIESADNVRLVPADVFVPELQSSPAAMPRRASVPPPPSDLEPDEDWEPATAFVSTEAAAAVDPAPVLPRRRVTRKATRAQRQAPFPERAANGELPPLELLDPPRKSGRAYSDEQLAEMSREVEARLADFGVAAEVVGVYPGPVVALFELDLAPGTKVSKITGLAKDIARALSRVSVRVVEVIPGKSVIGLEIPNDHREMVSLSEVLSSSVYQDAKSPLTIGMGTNIAGLPVVADLGRMPHALIAGTTGSGKSVAINAMILSLLYKSGAEDVRLIMVDPKMLELSVYEGIPHLLTPVVTDMKEAHNALRWCVGEMERRYKLMSKLGVRNIAGYNRMVQEAIDDGEPIEDPLYNFSADPFAEDAEIEVPTLGRLPYIVVIIDELADMMMVVGKKVEELIARLAQKARASGIHLLLATQRPSVDVLTGLIKANIPTRMAFKVSARVDSRTVLDQMGAENLLGHGDMLYLPPGGSIPQRVHGAFVDDHEVHHVVDYLKQFGPAQYIDTVLQDPTEHLPGIDPEPRGGGDVEDQDPLFDEAVQIVVESRRASISGVQRRLKIGYNRAARMIEEMERIGIVGAAESNGNREVLAPPPVDD